jgi:uncharacterized protein (UPF0303 family)
MQFHRSTFYLGCKLRREGKTIESLRKTETEMSIHGGGFPIRVRGIEGIVGVVCVSGLPQHEDHKLIVDSMRQLAKEEQA